MGITFKNHGNFSRTTKFLNHLLRNDYLNFLNKCGEEGVERLREFTPKDSGKTSESWSYEIINTKKGRAIDYKNSNIQNGLNIAILVDTGHATAQGKWVPGTHYIDETIKDICSYIDKKK